MNNKAQVISMLKEEFSQWEELLSSITETQIITPHLPGNLSIKDVVAHLWAWQQLSIARLEAARFNRKPEFSLWPSELEPEAEDDVEQINAWIYETYCEKPWSNVYHSWREGFLRFLELAESIAEKDLLDEKRYPWLEGHPLILVLMGSYEHHHEDHLEPLLAWRQPQL